MPTLVRTITYTGPQEWLDMCVDNAFVSLKQELGKGKSITSKWRDTKTQRRAQKIDDVMRKRFYMAARGGPQPRTHPLQGADKAILDKRAHQLAYTAAVAVIESETIGADDDWQSLEQADVEAIGPDFDYLQSRGLIERHPQVNHWIRILPENTETL